MIGPQMSKHEDEALKTAATIKAMVDPLESLERTVVNRHQLDAAHEAILLGDLQATLAEHRRKERAETVLDEETGLLKFEDKEPEELGDINIGPHITVNHKETPETAKPVQSNGSGKLLGPLLIGAMGATGLLGGGALAGYVISQLGKTDPPPVVQPVEPDPPPQSTIVLE